MYPQPASPRIRMAMSSVGVARSAMLRGIGELLIRTDRLLASTAAPTAACGSSALQSLLRPRWLSTSSTSRYSFDEAAVGASEGEPLDGPAHQYGTVSIAVYPSTRPNRGTDSPDNSQPCLRRPIAPRICAGLLPQPNALKTSGVLMDAPSSAVRWYTDSARGSSGSGSSSINDSTLSDAGSNSSQAESLSPAAAGAAGEAPAVSAAAVADANDVLRVRW